MFIHSATGYIFEVKLHPNKSFDVGLLHVKSEYFMNFVTEIIKTVEVMQSSEKALL